MECRYDNFLGQVTRNETTLHISGVQPGHLHPLVTEKKGRPMRGSVHEARGPYRRVVDSFLEYNYLDNTG